MLCDVPITHSRTQLSEVLSCLFVQPCVLFDCCMWFDCKTRHNQHRTVKNGNWNLSYQTATTIPSFTTDPKYPLFFFLPLWRHQPSINFYQRTWNTEVGLVQLLRSKQSQTEQVAQSCIQSSFERLQGRRLHRLFRQSVPAFSHPHWNSFFSCPHGNARILTCAHCLIFSLPKLSLWNTEDIFALLLSGKSKVWMSNFLWQICANL